VRTRRWKYGVHAPELDGSRNPTAERYEESYLYDLHSDPYELTNLLGLESHREVTARLRERLIRRAEAAGEPPPVIVPAPSRPSGQRRVSPLEIEG
jgi:hypothetical protein